MVPARIRKVIFIAVFGDIGIHFRNAGRLIVKGPHVQQLHAQALIHRQKLHGGEILLFLLRSLRNRPVKIRPRDEIRQANHRYPLKALLIGIIKAHRARLPPEALQRRHHIIKVPVDAVIAVLAHLDGKGHAVQ